MKLGDQVSIYQLTIKRNAHIEKFNKKQKRMRSQINKEIYTKIRERERENTNRSILIELKSLERVRIIRPHAGLRHDLLCWH